MEITSLVDFDCLMLITELLCIIDAYKNNYHNVLESKESTYFTIILKNIRKRLHDIYIDFSLNHGCVLCVCMWFESTEYDDQKRVKLQIGKNN